MPGYGRRGRQGLAEDLVAGDPHVLERGAAALRQALAEGVPVVAVGHAGPVARDDDHREAVGERGAQGDPVGDRGVRREGLPPVEPEAVPVRHEDGFGIAWV